MLTFVPFVLTGFHITQEPVYGIAWTGLYALMAAATYVVITEGGGEPKCSKVVTLSTDT